MLLSTQYFAPDFLFFQVFLPETPYFSSFFTICYFFECYFFRKLRLQMVALKVRTDGSEARGESHLSGLTEPPHFVY